MSGEGFSSGFHSGLAATAPPDHIKPKAPPRDLKRSFLIFGLGALSWVATYVGMLELIEANMGDLPIVHRIIIGFSVAMLMTMIIWLLDQMFRPQLFLTRVFYAAGYVFLSLISVGFGFGFYWKVLESRGESSRSAESAVTQVQSSLTAASTRLEQLQSTLMQLTAVSTSKAELERAKGTSCPNSKPGDGPRRKLREDDAQRFGFASEFVKGRVSTIKGEMTGLDADMAKIVSADAATFDAKTGTRNEFMRGLSRKLDMTVTGFNAFRTDPQLRQIRTDLADRAERSQFGDPKSGGFACPDAQLQTALRGVVKAIDQLPELTKPQIAAVEGSEATIEAFRRLTSTFYGLLAFKLPPSADELRDLQKRAVQSVEETPAASAASLRALNEQAGLSKRDYVPLGVALFVDICLFLVSMVQRPVGRLDGLVPKMQAAERGPVIEILSRFNDIHRDQQIRENFELFRHVVFDMNGDYYVAVPLDAPPRLNPAQREALRVEAQLLANLFASFEKEKIFKRTLLPTNASIQRRLARQGSKFAGSEAFRVYKFTDGAWSDIILGAVMGAARRIEAEQRTGRRAPAHTVPTSAPANDATAPAAPGGVAPDRMGQAARAAFAEIPRPRPSLPVDAAHSERFGPYATAYHPEPAFARAPQGPRVPWPAPPPLPEADVTVRAVNSAAAQAPAAAAHPTSAEHAGAHVVHLAPRQSSSSAPVLAVPDEPRASVTLQRETATFSLPASEAVLPATLRAAFTRMGDEAGVDAQLSAAPPKPAMLEPARSDVLEIEPYEADDEPIDEVTESAPLTDADRKFIARMAPPAAE